MITVLIVDDHPIILDGTKSLFQGIKDITIETDYNPKNVVERLRNTVFDVYLLDINMGPYDGISLAKSIKAIQENALVILYTGYDIRAYYSLILEKKIDGILSKTTPSEKVIRTIRSIVQGDIVLPIDFIDFLKHKVKNSYDNIELTNKEKHLLTMIMKGQTNKKIAENLGVTQRTVERYLSQLFTLLDVSSRDKAIELVKEKNLLLNQS
ncbi:response regulator transcription factor [Solibacillus sp. MA9]|uniref:Response regulator transcription factor n=1 Tax=Solibacillus palustris TaxID=2908203 RepID=A0ABS9UJ46_9BACL|nr:response regulator transcription factor [Solibacillus sp. MA9]MCH7324008.1 response regulator transcription factor [Solibacillus sp. MA9]